MCVKKYYFEDEDPLDEEKYLFMLLYAPGNSNKINEKIPGNTWLQKQMFLLEKIMPKIQFQFNEHNYGAYSPTLTALTKQNINSQLIKQQGIEGTGKLWLAEDGLEIAKKYWNDVPDNEKKSIVEVKKFMNDMGLWELIAYSYSTFPETTENSDVVKQFEETRIDSACSLFMRKKISVEKAASIAGLSLEDFISELKLRKIPAFQVNHSDFLKSLQSIESIT